MKIILNISNLYVGGSVQVAISFLNELKYLKEKNIYHIFLSKPIDTQILKSSFSNKFNFYLIKNSPAPLKTRLTITKQLSELEKTINPDIVFTLFGPSYWKPHNKNLVGFADPWILNKKSNAYNELTTFNKIRTKLSNFYKIYYLKKEANYFIIETKDGKNKLSKLLRIPDNKIFIVSNSYSDIFSNKNFLSKRNKFYIKLPNKEKKEFRLMLISHNYPHKNLRIIKKVIPLLRLHKIKFIITIDDKEYKNMFHGLDKDVINLNPIKINSCPSIYSQCDALFLPSLLEVFSASYLEAMKMKVPILTSNYSFAKDVCGNAALYFDPLNPNDIAEKIIKLENNKKIRLDLIEKGQIRLNRFETSRSRAEKYIKILDKLSKI